MSRKLIGSTGLLAAGFIALSCMNASASDYGYEFGLKSNDQKLKITTIFRGGNIFVTVAPLYTGAQDNKVINIDKSRHSNCLTKRKYSYEESIYNGKTCISIIFRHSNDFSLDYKDNSIVVDSLDKADIGKKSGQYTSWLISENPGGCTAKLISMKDFWGSQDNTKDNLFLNNAKIYCKKLK